MVLRYIKNVSDSHRDLAIDKFGGLWRSVTLHVGQPRVATFITASRV